MIAWTSTSTSNYLTGFVAKERLGARLSAVDAKIESRHRQLLSQHFLRSVTERIKRTLAALWFARKADSAPEMNHLMRKLNPACLRKQLHQILLNLNGLFVLRQVETL
jgi:hypothetical protein